MAKKLEKIFATALASFTLLSLAGCGGGGESHSKEKKIELLPDILYFMEQCLIYISLPKVFLLVEKMFGTLFEYGLSKSLVSLIRNYSFLSHTTHA